MLEKREVYRWHFVNHLAFRRSRRAIGIFMKRQTRTIRQVSNQVSRKIKDERNRQYWEKCIVIVSQCHKIVHKIVHKHVKRREAISV